MLEPEGYLVGTVNEDFAVESLSGDVFQLGNTSYRILRVERSVVRVEDARGEAPTIPFWLGEAPGRTDRVVGGSLAPAHRDRGAVGERHRVCARVAHARGRCFRGRRRAARRVSRRRARCARQPADAADDRVRALLRRSRRHAAGHSFALRQPHQSRVGPGAAQALLPHVQLRAAGRRDRRHDHSVADDRAQLRAGRGRALSASEHGARNSGAGAAGRADVHDALALGCVDRAGAAALPRRQEGPAARWRA